MAAPNADEDIRDFLASSLALTAGTEVFTGPELPPGGTTEAEAIFVQQNGGPVHSRTGGGTGGKDILVASVQVRIRGDREDPASARTLARSAHSALRRPDTSSGTLSSYMAVLARDATPVDIRKDQSDHPRWVFNVDVWMEL